MTFEIRNSRTDDWAALESLYPQAFPDEDLLPLLRDLLHDAVNVISLVATIAAEPAGHVIFTRCGVVGDGVTVALLGPLAVAPAQQKQGVGSALVRAGLGRLEDEDVALVCVLGDPAYYGRFGFRTESSLEPPYPLPAEWQSAWQSRCIATGATPCTGKLDVPGPWRKPELWAP